MVNRGILFVFVCLVYYPVLTHVQSTTVSILACSKVRNEGIADVVDQGLCCSRHSSSEFDVCGEWCNSIIS